MSDKAVRDFRARFSNDPEHFAFADIEGDTINGLCPRAFNIEVRFGVLDFRRVFLVSQQIPNLMREEARVPIAETREHLRIECFPEYLRQ
ncbi:MAG: hypothetical protein IPM83_11425 [Ignavibacteria bacterium]|nr:hypothetical protein [Ignavibacteria bacterium]